MTLEVGLVCAFVVLDVVIPLLDVFLFFFPSPSMWYGAFEKSLRLNRTAVAAMLSTRIVRPHLKEAAPAP